MKPIEEQKIRIGDLNISYYNEKSLWICRDDGEGIQVSTDRFYEMLNKWYEENF